MREERICVSKASIRPRSPNGRKLRDAGVLEGKQPGEKIGKLTPEQVEIARLRRQLELTDRRLVTTEMALEIMSKMHELLESLSKSSWDEPPQTRQ